MISGREKQIYRFDHFVVDPSSRSLSRDNSPISLNPKAFDLLLALLERPGEVVTKDQLLDRVWQGQFVEEGNLTVHVASVRKALGEKKKGHRYVATVPGRGYQFVGEVVADGHSLVIEEHSLSRITIEHGEDDLQAIRAALPEAQTITSKLSSRTTAMFAAGLIATLIAAFLFYRFGGAVISGRGAAAERTTRQLTHRGNVSGATMSPDGKSFVYRDNDLGLWYGNTAGGNPLQIQPPNGTSYDGLTLGRDGSEIYYTAGGNLMKMPVLGGPAQKVLEHVSAGFAFSPDGKEVAFIRNDLDLKTSSLMIKGLDGVEHEVTKISRAAAFTSFPAWSPDATRLAIGVEDIARPNQYALMSVDIGDGSMKPLDPQVWEIIGKAAWLHDGTGIIFDAVGPRSDFHIWMLDLGSGSLRCITNDLSRYGRGTVYVSDDGSNLLAVRDESSTSIWITPATDTQQLHQITNKAAGKLDGASGLSWISDKKIVDSSFFDNSYSIWTMNVDGSDARQITSSGFSDRFPQGTPDGERVVFQSNRGGGQDIWRVNTDGNDLRQLTNTGRSKSPDVTPDGQWVLFASNEGGVNSIWKIPIDGGEAARLINAPSDYPRVSPNGKYLACVYSETVNPTRFQIAVFPIDGGTPVYQFQMAPYGTFNNGLHWSPDGSSIVYRDYTSGLWRQSLAGGPPAKVEGLPNEDIFFFDWSKDGNSLALSYGSELRDVVLISNFK